MPDEYLPPNKILFLQNLPESVTKDQLTSLFSQCVLAFLFAVTLVLTTHQIPQPSRGPSHPDKEGHRFRRVHGRGECYCCEGRAAQLQVGWRKQDQGALSDFSLSCSLTDLGIRSHSRANRFGMWTISLVRFWCCRVSCPLLVLVRRSTHFFLEAVLLSNGRPL
jgi:RNA recognition motif-containing protein